MAASSKPVWRTAGYFTCLHFLMGLSVRELERRIGYEPTSLSDGWSLYRPVRPISADLIRFKGSTRYSDGEFITPKKGLIRIEKVIEANFDAHGVDIHEIRKKTAAFFRKSPLHTPVKIRSSKIPADYPSVQPVGVPQFFLATSIEWRLVHEFGRGEEPTSVDYRLAFF